MGDSSYYMYRQYTYAKIIAEKGFQGSYHQYELRLLALYYRDELDLKPKVRKDALQKFCAEHLLSYHPRAWYKEINRAVNYSRDKEHVLIECPSVNMYMSEIEYIDGLGVSENAKRTIFAIMVQKKLDKFSFETQHKDKGDYSVFMYKRANKRYRALKKVAKLKGVKDFDIDVMQELYANGLTEDIKTKDTPIKLNFADKIVFDGDVAVEVTDYEKLGEYWEWLHGESKVGLCKKCGRPFVMTVKNRAYCDEHRGYKKVTEVKMKVVSCVDCGGEFEVDARHMKKVRCDACQQEYRKATRRKVDGDCTFVI